MSYSNRILIIFNRIDEYDKQASTNSKSQNVDNDGKNESVANNATPKSLVEYSVKHNSDSETIWSDKDTAKENSIDKEPAFVDENKQKQNSNKLNNSFDNKKRKQDDHNNALRSKFKRFDQNRSSNQGSISCYNCKQSGHVSRVCPSKKQFGNKRDTGGSTCFNCHEIGHMSRECSLKKQFGSSNSSTCFNCNETGHMSREYPSNNRGGSNGSTYLYSKRDNQFVGAGETECFNCNEKVNINYITGA